MKSQPPLICRTSRRTQNQTLQTSLRNIGLLEHAEYVSRPWGRLSIRFQTTSLGCSSHHLQLHTNLLTLKAVDSCDLASVKVHLNTSMRVAFQPGDMRILNMEREIIGNALLADSAIV